ncbi:MAG: zinc ABC transporter substrate-binding protein [Candidatus Riflebacteria bacterium]|nr:zinc ABC transporter substrate-binding protein [Candidatus Riflebacteria bacterium]
MIKRCLLFGLLFLVCFNNTLIASETPKIKVFVSVLPQKYFVERIAGDFAEVEVLVGPEQSPHNYEPLPKQMSEIARAEVFFSVGVTYEKRFLKKIASLFPKLKIVATDEGIKKRNMSEVEGECEDHSDCEHSHEHGKGGLDPHIWLDPVLVIKQAEIIASALAELRPGITKELAVNYEVFKQENEKIVEELSKILEPLKGQTMLVFHPAFGYFADRFGLVQRSVEAEGKEPGPKQLAELIKKCRAKNIHVIFVQKQFPVAAAKTIAESINGVVMGMDPLSEDYFENLRFMANSLKKLKE